MAERMDAETQRLLHEALAKCEDTGDVGRLMASALHALGVRTHPVGHVIGFMLFLAEEDAPAFRHGVFQTLPPDVRADVLIVVRACAARINALPLCACDDCRRLAPVAQA